VAGNSFAVSRPVGVILSIADAEVSLFHIEEKANARSGVES
jgi:hypothetical protein